MAKKGKGLEGIGAGSSGWADLPEELLILIAERLFAHSRIDLLRFCATCSSWRSSARIHRRSMGCFRVPALIVSSNYQTIESKYYYYPVPFDDCYDMFTVYLVQQKSRNRTDSSSNKCWLAKVRERDYFSGEGKLHLELLSKNALGYNDNNIPKEFNISDLSMSELCKYYIWNGIRGRFSPWFIRDEKRSVQKIAFIFSRSIAGKYAAVGMYGNMGQLAFLKSSEDGTWIPINNYKSRGYNDVIDYNGKFYAVHQTGKLFRIDLSCKVTEIVSPIVKRTGGIQKTLVESAGDLLLVDKYIDLTKINEFRSERPPKCWFKVYKLNEEGETHKLVEIQSLGDTVLFLTSKYCFSISAKHLPGCTPNCIYLTEQCGNAYRMNYDSHQQLSTNFPAVFNLEDGSYRRINYNRVDTCYR